MPNENVFTTNSLSATTSEIFQTCHRLHGHTHIFISKSHKIVRKRQHFLIIAWIESVPKSKKVFPNLKKEPCNKATIIPDVKHLICLIKGTLPQRFSQNIWMCKTAQFTWIPRDRKEKITEMHLISGAQNWVYCGEEKSISTKWCASSARFVI